MYRVISLSLDAAVGTLVLTPVFFLLGRRRHQDTGLTVQYLLFAVYLCGVYAAAGLPGFHRVTYRPRVNLSFFAYMFSDYRSSLLNVLFFLPLGFFLPMLWRRFRQPLRTLLFGLGASAFVELFQLLTPRATDVNDLMTNTAGTLAGYVLAIFVQWLSPSMIPDNDSRDVYWICGLAVATMFLVHPLITMLL
ncbi:MAG: VanZ family protein [Eubacteriales bacterium]|nr:VanZ family protein [Eubacteriales bacterium]